MPACVTEHTPFIPTKSLSYPFSYPYSIPHITLLYTLELVSDLFVLTLATKYNGLTNTKTSKKDRMRRAMDSGGYDQCYEPAKNSKIICFQENEDMKTRGFIREIQSHEEDLSLQVDDADHDQNTPTTPNQSFQGEQQHDGDQHLGNTSAFCSSPLRCPTDHRGRFEAGEYRVQRTRHVPGPAQFDHEGKGVSKLMTFKGRKKPASRGSCAGILQNPFTGQPDQDRPLFPRFVKIDQRTNFPMSAHSPRSKKIDPRTPPRSLWTLAQQPADQIVTHGSLGYDTGEKTANNDWKSDLGLIALFIPVNDDKRSSHLIFSTPGLHFYSTAQPFRTQPAGYQTQPIGYSRQYKPLIPTRLQCLHRTSSIQIDPVRLCLDISGSKSFFR